VLSGDHIYKMDYAQMVDFHKRNNAAVTISTIEVPWDEASRFGIVVTDENHNVVRFDEKPKNPVSNLASMGIYVFSWKAMRKALLEDHEDPDSSNDFGSNILPKMLVEGQKLMAYPFQGYWRDVGTIPSYYETSMELLDPDCPLHLDDRKFPVYSNSKATMPQYVGPEAHVSESMICDGCKIMGEVHHSILSQGVVIGRGARVHNSILLPGAVVQDGAEVYEAILDENTVVERGQVIGSAHGSQGISVLSNSNGLQLG